MNSEFAGATYIVLPQDYSSSNVCMLLALNFCFLLDKEMTI